MKSRVRRKPAPASPSMQQGTAHSSSLAQTRPWLVSRAAEWGYQSPAVKANEQEAVKSRVGASTAGAEVDQGDQPGIWLVVKDLDRKELLRVQIDLNSTDNLQGNADALKFHKALRYLYDGEVAMGDNSYHIIDRMLASTEGFEFTVGPYVRVGNAGSTAESWYAAEVSLENTVPGESPAFDNLGHEMGHMWSDYNLDNFELIATGAQEFVVEAIDSKPVIKVWHFKGEYFFNGESHTKTTIIEAKKAFKANNGAELLEINEYRKDYVSNKEYLATMIQNYFREAYGLPPMKYNRDAAKNFNQVKVADPTYLGNTKTTPPLPSR